MAERDAISKAWFDTDSVTVHVNDDLSDYIKLAEYFSDSEIIRLSGAFAGAGIQVKPEFTKPDAAGNRALEGIRLSVSHTAVMRMERILRITAGGGWILHNAKIRIRPASAGKNLGARIVAIQARAAQELGFEAIQLDAVGNHQQACIRFQEDRWVGYWLWPRLGFDAPIPAHVFRSLLPEFKHCERVSELLQSEDGINWWQLYGDSLDDARFDLTPDSVSWQLLVSYLSERDIKV